MTFPIFSVVSVKVKDQQIHTEITGMEDQHMQAESSRTKQQGVSLCKIFNDLLCSCVQGLVIPPSTNFLRMAVTEVLCFESGSVKGKKQYQCIAKHDVAIRALAGDRRRWPKILPCFTQT